MEQEYFIYLTTNHVNGKKYIGKHQGLINDEYLGSGKILKKAIKKYGKENFSRQILDFSHNEKENCEKERYYIALFDACNSDMFYNIHEGGAGGNTLKGLSPEEKQALSKKISERTKGEKNPMYGVKRSEEWKKQQSYWASHIRDNSCYRTKEFRKKMSELTSGTKNGMYGKRHSEKTKQIISEKAKGRTVGEKNGMYGKKGDNAINGKRIVMLDEERKPIRTFACKQAALAFLGLKGHIGLDKAIRENTLYKGYYWKNIDKDRSVETIS